MTESQATVPSVSLTDLALGFGKIAIASFGGGLSAWARLIIVEQRRWLNDDEFLSALTLCRVLPGPNQLNMAVYVGTRLRGWPGALAALVGLLTLPFLIVLGLAVIYFNYHHMPQVKSFLRGVTAASVGLTLSMGFKVIGHYRTDVAAWLFIAAAFVSAGILRWPLLPTLVVLGSLGIYWYWPRDKAGTSKEATP